MDFRLFRNQKFGFSFLAIVRFAPKRICLLSILFTAVADACTTSPPQHTAYSPPLEPVLILASAAPYAPEAECTE
jgi:hypothetical protein